MARVSTVEETPIYHELLHDLGMEDGLFEDEMVEESSGRLGSHRAGDVTG